MTISCSRLKDDAYRWQVIEGLMRDQGTAIMQFCTTWLGDGLAEEMTQDVFVTAWEKLPTFRPVAPIDTWLFGIARNKCKQAFRNRARRRAIDRTFLEDIRRHAHTETASMPEHAVAQETQLARLHDCLSRLHEEERILLNLRYRRGLSTLEIAEVVGKSAAAVRKRLDRAKQRLRGMMHDAQEG